MRYEWAIKRKEKNITKYEHWPYLKVKCSFTKKKIVSVLSKRPNFFTTKAFVRAQCKRSPRLWISALLVVPTLWRLSWTLSAAVQHFVPLLHYTDKQLKNEVLLFWYSSLNKVSLFCFKWKKTRTKNSSNTP